ncbi:NAD-dependent deacetylase [Chloroflexota bacterium]
MQSSDLEKRVDTVARWMLEVSHLVIFTGAGISTESGLPDFRGPDGLWTRQARGLPPPKFDWSSAKPNQAHIAIVELQNMGKLSFIISQNVDNLHLKSGIRPDLLAELHGNITRLRCRGCGFKCDSFPDLVTCPICGGRLASSVVHFGDSLPEKDLEEAEWHSQRCDLFIVVGSSLGVYPAANMPRIALESGSKLVIVNKEDTPLDSACHLRFRERAGEVLPWALAVLKEIT